MKKIISFEKKIEFPSMIGEITSITLDNDLKFINPSFIEGNFVVKGSYKLTEASRIEDKFEYKLPAEILLNEKLDLKTTKIEIDDFYYEIEDEENLVCYIDVLVEGVEEIDLPEEVDLKISEIESIEDDDLRECDGDLKMEEKFETKENKLNIEQLDLQEENKKNENVQSNKTINSLFSSLNDDEDTFSTYSVYIIREGDTIETVLNKYKITKEDLEEYNDLTELKNGTKIIIPIVNE